MAARNALQPASNTAPTAICTMSSSIPVPESPFLKDYPAPATDTKALRAPRLTAALAARGVRRHSSVMIRFAPHMEMALAEARAAFARAETPVGALIVDPVTDRVIAHAGNRTRELHDPTAHAEILVIRAACASLGRERLPGLDLYVTLEPCAMCAAAISAARIGRLFYGATDPKSGGVEHGARVFVHAQSHHKPEVWGGIAERESQALMRAFFAERR